MPSEHPTSAPSTSEDAGTGVGVFVDPRTDPEPPSVPRPLAASGREVEDLLRLCQTGRIYAVEKWIAGGRPIQAEQYVLGARPYAGSPAAIAIETGQRDLLSLLLCNGYQVARDDAQPLDRALRARQWDVVDLLLRWEADPTSVDPYAVLDSYRVDLFDRFWEAGADLNRDNYLAYSLALTTSNRPLYGWARKRQDEPAIKRALTMALVQAIYEGKDRGVYMTRWAGADPHIKVPLLQWHIAGVPDEDQDVQSAIELAVSLGCGRFLRKLGPDPAIDDFEHLWSCVSDPDAVDFLVTIQPPRDWSPTILRALNDIPYSLGSDRSAANRRCLLRIGYHGGRLTTVEARQIADLRRDFVRMRHRDVQEWMLWWLRDPRRCEPSIYREFARTLKMREILAESGRTRRTAG